MTNGMANPNANKYALLVKFVLALFLGVPVSISPHSPVPVSTGFFVCGFCGVCGVCGSITYLYRRYPRIALRAL